MSKTKPKSVCTPHTFLNITRASFKELRTSFHYNKQWFLIVILCTFLGIFGVHRFAVKRWKTGILYVLTLGIFGIGFLLDFLALFFHRFKDKYGDNIESELSFPQRFVILCLFACGIEFFIFGCKTVPSPLYTVYPYVIYGIQWFFSQEIVQSIVKAIDSFLRSL